MGMGMGMSPADMARFQLLQAKGELQTLNGRIEVTEKSIERLSGSLDNPSENVLERVEGKLNALIETNLLQLRGNLAEGNERAEYLKKAISSAESPVKRALVIPPSKH
jgi:chromosome segregation ATPase